MNFFGSSKCPNEVDIIILIIYFQFPILAQVTSKSPDHVPGYALEELSRLTFQSPSLTIHMVDYYTSK